MEAKDVVHNIRQALNQLEESGQQTASVSGLRQYLDQVEKDATVSIEIQKLQHESSLAHYKATSDFALEMFRSVMGFAHHALKTIIIVNGGAAIAVLAFIGNIWSKLQAVEVARALTFSEAWFAIGVLVGAIATGTTYIAQYFYERKTFYKSAIGFHIVTIILVVGAYVLFAFGIYSIYAALSSQLSKGHSEVMVWVSNLERII